MFHQKIKAKTIIIFSLIAGGSCSCCSCYLDIGSLKSAQILHTRLVSLTMNPFPHAEIPPVTRVMVTFHHISWEKTWTKRNMGVCNACVCSGVCSVETSQPRSSCHQTISPSDTGIEVSFYSGESILIAASKLLILNRMEFFPF